MNACSSSLSDSALDQGYNRTVEGTWIDPFIAFSIEKCFSSVGITKTMKIIIAESTLQDEIVRLEKLTRILEKHSF